MSPEDGSDIVREVVPAECESVGGLREQLGRGSHVAPVAASDCRLPTLPDLSAAWLSRLSIPARTAPERLSDPTRTTFLPCTAHCVEARAMLHCCIDQVTNIFAIAFHQPVQADCKLQPAGYSCFSSLCTFTWWGLLAAVHDISRSKDRLSADYWKYDGTMNMALLVQDMI